MTSKEMLETYGCKTIERFQYGDLIQYNDPSKTWDVSGYYNRSIPHSDISCILTNCFYTNESIHMTTKLQNLLWDYFVQQKQKNDERKEQRKEMSRKIHEDVLKTISQSPLARQTWTIKDLIISLHETGITPYSVQAYAYHIQKGVKEGKIQIVNLTSSSYLTIPVRYTHKRMKMTEINFLTAPKNEVRYTWIG